MGIDHDTAAFAANSIRRGWKEMGSACVTNRTDLESQYKQRVSTQWWAQQRHRHEVILSEEVLRELSDPSYARREEAISFSDGIGMLQVTDAVRDLARILVRERVMPGPAGAGDAIHVAVATVDQCDAMITWNVRHLANVNKTRHLQQVCRSVGREPPVIVTPDLLWGYDE